MKCGYKKMASKPQPISMPFRYKAGLSPTKIFANATAYLKYVDLSVVIIRIQSLPVHV